jgi:hypothetical protein
MKRATLVWLAALLLAPAGCATVTIKPVDFSWSYESVLTADSAGVVSGEPKTIAFDAGVLFRAEAPSQGAAAGKTVRIIRDKDGYYFVTSPGFRHVYIFGSSRGKLTLEKKVLITEAGMEKPFFNRRDGGIELGADGQVYLLTRKGIVSGGKK